MKTKIYMCLQSPMSLVWASGITGSWWRPQDGHTDVTKKSRIQRVPNVNTIPCTGQKLYKMLKSVERHMVLVLAKKVLLFMSLIILSGVIKHICWSFCMCLPSKPLKTFWKWRCFCETQLLCTRCFQRQQTLSTPILWCQLSSENILTRSSVGRMSIGESSEPLVWNASRDNAIFHDLYSQVLQDQQIIFRFRLF